MTSPPCKLLSEDDEINKSCNALLCDLKSVEAKPVLLAAIQDKKYESIRTKRKVSRRSAAKPCGITERSVHLSYATFDGPIGSIAFVEGCLKRHCESKDCDS